MQPRILTVIAGLVVGLVATQALGLFSGETFPTIFSPVPVLLLVLAFAVQDLAVAVIVVLFWIFSRQLFRGDPEVPRRTFILFGVTAVVSILTYVGLWQSESQYPGRRFVIVCGSVSAVMLLCSVALILRMRSRPTFAGSVALHTLTFCWIVSYAFPYTGELP